MTTETLKEEDIGNCECSEKISEEKVSCHSKTIITIT